ncbi:acyltransferase [Frigidibacter sp. MR17.14]|uniref:acyltransferase family protein n=1 Tax=Frigidibacter sp. MR17.14 TaxID=3126509 RepID=UPI003012E830
MDAGFTVRGPGAESQSPRWKQLDGLRCIAMVGVLYVHYWNKTPVIENVRVALFFVVSGFLITAILLRARDRGLRSLVVARNFYIRRALRLLPALMIALGVAACFNMADIRASLPFHLLQMTDIYISLTAEPGQWKPWIVTHLWSLNVLERFYLLWPVVVLLLPMPAVVTVTVIAAILPPLVRMNLDALGLREMFYVTFSWGPIAWGALLALLVRRAPQTATRTLTGPMPLLLALATLVLPWFVEQRIGVNEAYRLASNLALCLLVLGACKGYPGAAGRLLSSRAATWISSISYATYVYHMPIWWLAGAVWPQLYPPGPVPFLLLTPLCLTAATLTRVLVELPLERLRLRFPTAPAVTLGPKSVA